MILERVIALRTKYFLREKLFVVERLNQLECDVTFGLENRSRSKVIAFCRKISMFFFLMKMKEENLN
jgi:hypothetical protein